ncbi:MAG TPA: M23 family metallopeptidase [Herpetosiphonaceae bacterium]
MTTLHALRRTYALTFSELSLVTGVGTRRLAAFEYQGRPLSPDERHRVASFFGLADTTLEGGLVARQIVEPTLSSGRARTLVAVAAALTITWGLQSAHADELDPVSAPLSASLSAASAYVAEVQSSAVPNPLSESLGVAAEMLRATDTPQAESVPAAPEQPSPPPAEAIVPPAAPPTATPTATALPSEPQQPPPASAEDVAGEINVPGLPGLPADLVWPTAFPKPAEPTAAPPAPTPAPSVTVSWGKDAYENNYDFDHAPTIAVNEPVAGLNFVCPDDSGCTDNDFFQVQLTGGTCYRVATDHLSPGIDTNVIVYGPERNRRPPLGGNDNAAPGELRSQIDLCVPGRGPKTGFILVGNHGNQRPAEPVAERTYTLQVTRLESSAKAGEPHRCPLEPERGSVIVVQGWGVGTHAPAAQWGGVDLIVQGGPTAGTPIVASHSGRVQVVLNSWPAGNYVAISSDAGWRTAYAHLSSVLVGNGDYVEAGTIIGTVGQTGWATGPHLHYETWRQGVNVDPAPYLFCR